MIRNFLFSLLFFTGIIFISIIFLPSFFFPRQIVLTGGKLMGYWSSFCLKFILSVKILIKGKENIINQEKFFIAASHQSMFETFYLQTIFNSPVFILKKELLLIPIFGWYLKKIGSISIKRNKVSKDNLYVVPTLLASMAEVDVRKSNGQLIEGKKIVNSIACIYYPSSDKSALNEMSLNSQVRVAWGGMEAVENIINLPRKFGCEDIVFGPKTSFMVIGSEKLSNLEDSKKIAKKASIDASQFEQQGCNAPHTVFVEKGGEISPLEFSKLLSSEMELTSKRIVRDPGVVPDVGKILTLRAKYEMMGEAFYSKGLEWTVLFSEDDKGLAEPCYFRTLFVRPIDDVMLVENYCSHLTQTAGVALSDERKEQFALRVTAKGIDRVPDIGAMSAYEVPWDGIFMIDRLVRWCKIS